MVEWHHQLNGLEFEQTLRDSEGQGSLVCCSPCGCKEVRHDHPTEKHQQNYSAIKRNEILPFATMWMDLENIILIEMLSLVCGIYK